MLRNLLLLAAENSAENYGVQLIDEFKRRNPEINIFGVGGEKFRKRGVEIILHNREFAIIGLVEVVSSIIKLKKYMGLILRTAIEKKADAVLLIDYPDFNLRLAKKFKRQGIPVYYYISPTVWAWRYSRVKVIRKYVDHIFIIFPFEIEIFQKEKIPFTYTGHPLIPLIKVKEPKRQFKKRAGIDDRDTIITLLPGSRKSEVAFLLPEMLEAMKRLNRQRKIKLFLLKADSIEEDFISGFLRKSSLHVTLIEQDQGYDLINASDLVVTTCGTSNLEIAVLGIPFIAVYRLNPLSYKLGKNFVKIKLYSIVNILAGQEVVPELIQQECDAQNIVAQSLKILNGLEIRQKMLASFKLIKKQLTQNQNPPQIIYDKIYDDLH